MAPNETNEDLAIKVYSLLKNRVGLSEGAIIAVTQVLPNFVDGCPWAFVNTDVVEIIIEDFNDINATPGFHISEVNRNRSNPGLVSPDNEFLITITVEAMVRILQTLGLTQVYGSAEHVRAKQKRADNQNRLVKHLQDQIKKTGKVEGFKGLYNLNESPTITHKGETFPAFAVTEADLVYALNLVGSPAKPGSGWGKKFDRHATVDRIIAPSGNALLMYLV